MRRVLAILWFVVAVLVLAGHAGRFPGLADAGMSGMMASVAPMAVSSAMLLSVFGLVYWLADRARCDVVVFVLGYIHLLLAALAQAAQILGGYTQDRMYESGDFDSFNLTVYFGISTVAWIFSLIMMLIAFIVAVNTAKAHEPGETFG